MGRIRSFYFFDKNDVSNLECLVSSCSRYNDAYSSFAILQKILPIKFKLIPESYIITDDLGIKAAISLSPLKDYTNKMEIQSLLANQEHLEEAIELIQYATSKYKAKGASSIIIKVEDTHLELIKALITKCNFTQISYEKLWKINSFNSDRIDIQDTIIRPFNNSDSAQVSNLCNESIFTHFRTLIGYDSNGFKEKICKGLCTYNDYKYVIQNHKNSDITAYFSIFTYDNINFIIDAVQSHNCNIDIATIINFATKQIKKRKNKFGLFIKSKRYLNIGEAYEEYFKKCGYTCTQNTVVLTNSSSSILKTNIKKPNTKILSNIISIDALPN